MAGQTRGLIAQGVPVRRVNGQSLPVPTEV